MFNLVMGDGCDVMFMDVFSLLLIADSSRRCHETTALCNLRNRAVWLVGPSSRRGPQTGQGGMPDTMPKLRRPPKRLARWGKYQLDDDDRELMEQYDIRLQEVLACAWAYWSSSPKSLGMGTMRKDWVSHASGGFVRCTAHTEPHLACQVEHQSPRQQTCHKHTDTGTVRVACVSGRMSSFPRRTGAQSTA